MTTQRRKRHNPEQIVRKLPDSDGVHSAGKELTAVMKASGQPKFRPHGK